MKKFKISGILVSLLSVFSNQFVMAEDVPLKKDDPTIQPNGITMDGMIRTKSISRVSTSSFIPVTADIVNSELIVDFSKSVGNAYVVVVDQNGNVIYSNLVDTYASTELIIPLTDLSSGKYSLKISYGTTRLTGDFGL